MPYRTTPHAQLASIAHVSAENLRQVDCEMVSLHGCDHEEGYATISHATDTLRWAAERLNSEVLHHFIDDFEKVCVEPLFFEGGEPSATCLKKRIEAVVRRLEVVSVVLAAGTRPTMQLDELLQRFGPRRMVVRGVPTL